MPPTDLYSLDAYDYALPEDLIAQAPANPRDSSRLLVIDRARGQWEHRSFRDLPEYFGANDVLVANNTRVIKARLLGQRLLLAEGGLPGRLGGQVEFVLLERQAPCVWEGLFKASARYVPGLAFSIPTPDGKGIRGELIRGSKDSPHGTVVARFDRDPVEADAGELPLPHYIRKPDAEQAAESYQTVFAKEPGSAAAPTAGLHFTPRVLEALRANGASWEEVTLNVGLGTFRPVKVEDIREHAMHAEQYEIAASIAGRINSAKQAGKKICAVGTTSVRTLESAWDQDQSKLNAGSGRTSIFIYPGGVPFRVVDRLLTNFHLPKSTLLMLVCAFAGRELALAAYKEAVREKYRFFSYGDSMLIL